MPLDLRSISEPVIHSPDIMKPAPHRIALAKGKTAEAANATIELMRDDPALFDFGG